VDPKDEAQLRTRGSLVRRARPAWHRTAVTATAAGVVLVGIAAYTTDTYATQKTCDAISGIGVHGGGYDSVKDTFGDHAGLLVLHRGLRHAVGALADDEAKRQVIEARETTSGPTAETVKAIRRLQDDIESRARVAQAACGLPVVGVLFAVEENSIAPDVTKTAKKTAKPGSTPAVAKPVVSR
jgi:hypothetical protein